MTLRLVAFGCLSFSLLSVANAVVQGQGQDEHRVAFAGENVEFYCGAASSQAVRWDHKSWTTSADVTIYNARRVNVELLGRRYDVMYSSNNATSRLLVVRVLPNDTGRYRCLDEFNPNGPPKVLVQLTILAAQPSCLSTYIKRLRPDDIIQIECDVNYTGPLNPDSECQSVPGHTTVAGPARTATGDATSRSVVFLYAMDASEFDGDTKFRCSTNFRPLNSSSVDTVTFSYQWMSPTVTQIREGGLRSVSIRPSNISTLEHGKTLSCTAEGVDTNYSYEWTEPLTGVSLENGSTWTVDVCEVSSALQTYWQRNVANSVRYAATVERQFTVQCTARDVQAGRSVSVNVSFHLQGLHSPACVLPAFAEADTTNTYQPSIGVSGFTTLISIIVVLAVVVIICGVTMAIVVNRRRGKQDHGPGSQAASIETEHKYDEITDEEPADISYQNDGQTRPYGSLEQSTLEQSPRPIMTAYAKLSIGETVQTQIGESQMD